jgi:hypothetical protein
MPGAGPSSSGYAQTTYSTMTRPPAANPNAPTINLMSAWLEQQARERAAAAERERVAAEARRIAAEEIEKARLADEAKRKAEEEARKAAQPPAPPQDLPQTTTPTIDLPGVRETPPGGQEQLPPAKSNTGLLLALGAGGLALLFFANRGD